MIDGHEEEELGPEPHLVELQEKFLIATELVREGREAEATEVFKAILAREPRLAEPRMELARILLDQGQLDEAEAHAREALARLEAGGQWVEDLPPKVVEGMAHGLLAEVLRQVSDTDQLVFGDPVRFQAITREAHLHFAEAARLDPDNNHATHHSFYLGLGSEE